MGNRREYEDCCLLGCDVASFDVEDPIFGGTRCLQILGDDLVKRDQHFGQKFLPPYSERHQLFRDTSCLHLQGDGAEERFQCCKRYFSFHLQKTINISGMLASSPFREMVR
jgi:hypothetical protein